MGTLAESAIFTYLSGLKKDYGGKGVFLTRKETRAWLGRIEVGGEENSKWMGQQMKKSVGRLPIECQGL